MALRAPSTLCSLLLTALLAGCIEPPPDGVLAVTLASAADGAPLAGALVAIEEGGLFVPAYTYGAQAGIEPTGEEEVPPVPGAFTILLPGGPKGLHVFAEGYSVASAGVEVTPKGREYQTLDIRPLPLPEETPRPTTTELRFSPSAAQPGEPVELSVAVAGAEGDAISDQVVVIQPDQRISAALNPPAPPEGEDPPEGPVDGIWTVGLTAPLERGAYAYYVVATSQAGVPAPIQSVTLIVD